MTKNNINFKTVFLVIVLVAVAMLGLVVLFTLPYYITTERLLYRMQIAKPGMNIELVMNQLGRKITETSDVQEMEYWNRWGGIEDASFFYGKKLYRFYITPPCRVLEIYTDTNNVIVFVTWKTM